MRILGFLDAVKDIGRREAEKYQDEFSDIDSFVEMPADKLTQEIRVWLKVEDVQAETLKVLGISKIDIAEFGSGNDDERIKKRRYLYRNKAGGNAKWRFSPIHQLGKGHSKVKDAKEILIDGKFLKSKWQKEKSVFEKIYETILNDMEKNKVFSYGSVDKIMECLKENVDRIAELWNDRRSSYLLIFSPISEDGHFMYPLNVKAYLSYFRSKIKGQGRKESQRPAKQHDDMRFCALCRSHTSRTVNLDKIFKFATFDKESFLPGIKASDKSKGKMFPICQDCYKALSGGKARVDEKFCDSKSINGVNIYVVPELLTGSADMRHAVQFNEDFLTKGLSNEGHLSDRIMKMDDSVVLHFVFWEKDQKNDGVRLLLTVEDVPPSRLRHIEDTWDISAKATGGPDFSGDSSVNSRLYRIIGLMWSRIMELAGKKDKVKNYARDWMLGIEGKILSGERINVDEVKTFFVSRLQGLCADHEWVQNKSKYFARDVSCIIDFLYRLNEED